MRRTNILLEFDDEVYDTLVEPLKKNKAFTKLVVTLIDGYATDKYIRAYADDTLDGMRNKAVSSFNESIASMNETLAEMGLVTDELESTAMGGRDMFRKQAQDQAEELGKTSDVGVSSTQDLDLVNKRMDQMQQTMESMMQMLSSLLQSGVSVGSAKVKEKVVPVSEERVTPAIEERVVPVSEERVTPVIETAKEESLDVKAPEPNEESVDVDVNEDSDDDVNIANDFMASMLSGNVFEY